ncbi:winged helix-turn-helix domain-containing protein [Sphingomicrobium flavum]|uniref:winged helix-turn-helix domain-containing protein n=1 Tax=Sphingomicrobium flavum TaxID=1229164 RepID=UPI0021ADDF0F|nr:transcriptional regulator [Sphingomicrobium flavum]
MADLIHFADFTLDPAAHQLRRDGAPVALQPRPFDLLALLAANPGRLFSKDELFEAVWPGVTVGDEALTQAIKEVRKALVDDAANPRFIETVPKRGYRFIAAAPALAATKPDGSWQKTVLVGTLGGGMAGLVGGMAYGLVAGLGNDAALAILVVMTVITLALAALGSLGIMLGMAAASRIFGKPFLFSVVGAALGGFIVGDLFHLLASGSFSLFLGDPHDEFTGGLEGLILGAMIALGARAGGGMDGIWPRPVIGAALSGLGAGVLISLLGGKLMASSLAALARRFHGSQLDLGMFGSLAGNGSLGRWTEAAVAGGEGLLLGGFMVAALLWRQESPGRTIITA